MPVPAAEKLLARRLVAFGIPQADADRIVAEQRIRHQWGPKKRDVEFLSLRLFTNPTLRSFLSGLALAEHIARVYASWDRCYAVNTTRLAMNARAV